MRSKIKVAGHAVQGRGHATKNIGCQDKICAYRFKDKRSAFIALADGAGSCKHSHLGAEYVASEVGNIVHNNFEHFLSKPVNTSSEIATKLQEGLKCLAQSEKIDFKSLSSTLLFVYIRRKKKSTRFVTGHIGDDIIAIRKNGKLRVLSHPQKGEYANTTTFLTSSHASNYLRIYTGLTNGNAGFLLLSDGTSESLYRNRDGVLAPACKTILSWFDRIPQKKAELTIKKNLEQVFRTMTLDDCSIAALGITGLQRVKKGKVKI